MKLVFRIRTSKVSGPNCDIWLLDGTAGSQCLAHGKVYSDRADELRDWFKEQGVKIEEEQYPFEESS